MDDKVFCVLVRNNNVGLTSLYYWQSFKLGGGAYISNPVWLGTWNEMNVFSSDCIFPTKIESTVESRFPDKGLATHERFHSFRFKVSKIVVRQVFFRDVCKSASCDGRQASPFSHRALHFKCIIRYGTECHCFGGSGTPTIKKLFGVQISADCFAGLDVKPFYSHALANLLLPSAMIYGDVPPDYAKIKLHVKTELERHDGYLLTVWSKPARTQKDDVATFSKIHITALQPTGQPLTQLILNQQIGFIESQTGAQGHEPLPFYLFF